MPSPTPTPLERFALCRPDHVKDYLDTTMSAAQDGVMVEMINAFSLTAQAPAYCNRLFEKKPFDPGYTEYFHGGVWHVDLQAPPIGIGEDGEYQIEVFDDPARAYGETTKLRLWDDYEVRTGPRVAQIVMRHRPFRYGGRSVKVVYAGGCVLNIDADPNQFVAPADLRTACAMQVATWFKNKGDLAAVATALPTTGSVTLYKPTDFLPMVYKILMANQRAAY